MEKGDPVDFPSERWERRAIMVIPVGGKYCTNIECWLWPQTFVVVVTMIREAFDDFNRFFRDRDVNNQKYKKLTRAGVVSVESARIRVGDLIIVEKVCLAGMIASVADVTFLFWLELAKHKAAFEHFWGT